MAEDAGLSPPKAVVQEDDAVTQVKRFATPSLAITFTKPKMEDTFDKLDEGTALLVIWSLSHLKWTYVAVGKNETTFALVQKDPDEERGKRMCANGTIIQIEVDKTADGKVFHGLLMEQNGNLYKFAAVGSTGALVAQSPARFCGFVTGKHDYANSMGGTGHAIRVVGMFDLPENKN